MEVAVVYHMKHPEAFYFARPLVTSNLDFARELCGQAALFAEPQNAAEFAARILILLDNITMCLNLIEKAKQQLSSQYPTATQSYETKITLFKSLAGRREIVFARRASLVPDEADE